MHTFRAGREPRFRIVVPAARVRAAYVTLIGRKNPLSSTSGSR